MIQFQGQTIFSHLSSKLIALEGKRETVPRLKGRWLKASVGLRYSRLWQRQIVMNPAIDGFRGYYS